MKETVEQFIARGGIVSRLEAQKVPENIHVLPVKPNVSMSELDLATGSDLYSESALNGKPNHRVKLYKKSKIKINPDLLPPSLLGLLNSLEGLADEPGSKKQVVREG